MSRFWFEIENWWRKYFQFLISNCINEYADRSKSIYPQRGFKMITKIGCIFFQILWESVIFWSFLLPRYFSISFERPAPTFILQLLVLGLEGLRGWGAFGFRTWGLVALRVLGLVGLRIWGFDGFEYLKYWWSPVVQIKKQNTITRSLTNCLFCLLFCPSSRRQCQSISCSTFLLVYIYVGTFFNKFLHVREKLDSP